MSAAAPATAPARRPPPPPSRGPFGGPSLPAEKAMSFGPSARRLAARLRPERALVALVILLGAASVALSVVGPKILGEATTLIYAGFIARSPIDMPALHAILLWTVAIYVASSLFGLAQGYILNGVTQRTVFRLREQVEAKLHRLPLTYFDKHPRGDLLSRVTNDIDNISQTLQQTLSQLFTSLLRVVGVIAMMFIISPPLALIALVSIPATVAIATLVARRSQRLFVAQWTHTGDLNAQIEETYTGHALVKVFGRQREVSERFRQKNEELYRASFGAQFVSGVIMPATMFVGNVVFVAVAVVGGLMIAAGTLPIGDVQAFIQYARQFQQPLSQLGSMANLLQSGVASAERVFALLDAAEERPDAAPAESPAAARGRLAFEHVAFRYDPDEPLIEDLSLVVEPGQTIAIVGPTGAGKTTLVNLVMRFYELTGGRITLDGVDIARMTRDDLRGRVAMVLQDAWLFGGTIRANIAYGRTGVSEEELQAAARAAYVDRFVHSLPEGYDTVLDDEASNVSAGERQLITIARAFVARSSVLILDEATSSVDTRTELLVQRAMAGLRKDRTSFVIAHRLSTIRDADVILVMERGSIVEKGTHGELLERGGAYARLYEAQFAAPARPIEAPIAPMAPPDTDVVAAFEAPATPRPQGPPHAGELAPPLRRAEEADEAGGGESTEG